MSGELQADVYVLVEVRLGIGALFEGKIDY